MINPDTRYHILTVSDEETVPWDVNVQTWIDENVDVSVEFLTHAIIPQACIWESEYEIPLFLLDEDECKLDVEVNVHTSPSIAIYGSGTELDTFTVILGFQDLAEEGDEEDDSQSGYQRPYLRHK